MSFALFSIAFFCIRRLFPEIGFMEKYKEEECPTKRTALKSFVSNFRGLLKIFGTDLRGDSRLVAEPSCFSGLFVITDSLYTTRISAFALLFFTRCLIQI